ncbi:ATP-binding protein [Streptomyces sp. NPDC002851]
MVRRKLQYLPHGFRVAGCVEAVPPARRRVVEIAQDLGVSLSDEAKRDLELMAGEVVTNAITHAEEACVVYVRRMGQRIRVEVTDVDARLPSPVSAASDDEGGRGLLLVQALAAAWGTQPNPAGKTVWFEVALSSTPPESESPTRTLPTKTGDPVEHGRTHRTAGAQVTGSALDLAVRGSGSGHHAA